MLLISSHATNQIKNKEINGLRAKRTPYLQALRSKGQGAERRRVRNDPKDQMNSLIAKQLLILAWIKFIYFFS